MEDLEILLAPCPHGLIYGSNILEDLRYLIIILCCNHLCRSILFGITFVGIVEITALLDILTEILGLNFK